jgi:hypothetical protein
MRCDPQYDVDEKKIVRHHFVEGARPLMLKNAWKDPVWSTVFATGILLILGSIVTTAKGWWPKILEFLSQAWEFIFSSTQTPNWLLAIMLICTIGTVCVLIIVAIDALRPGEKTPTGREYCADIFFGTKIKWQYTTGGQINSVASFCPACDMQICARQIYGYAAGGPTLRFICDSCEWQSELIKGHDTFRAQIMR